MGDTKTRKMKNIDLEILLKHLNGESTAEEEKILNAWILENEENQREYNAVKEIWTTPDFDFPKPDTAEALRIVKERLNIATDQERNNIYSINSTIAKKSILESIFSTQFIRAAALIIIAAGAIFYFFNLFNSTKMVDINVRLKNIEKLALNDGTIVTLDAGSEFSYPENFDGKLREVFLKGEAYFEVAENKNKPFVVHARNAVITVLGTKFDVNAWENNKRVDVALVEGKVSLHSEDSGGKDKVVLSEGQISRLADNGIPTKPEPANVTEYISWMNREKYFSNTSISEVANQIERWYGVQLKFPDKIDLSARISIQIKDLPVEDVVELFSAVLDLKYNIKGSIITFR